MSSIYVVCVASRAQGIEHGVDIEIDASTAFHTILGGNDN